MISPITGAVHTIYKQCSTATGRFASGDTKNGHPNMAQIPKDNQYRIPFKARVGYKLMTIDFSACELTILASMSKDKTLIRLLMDDTADLHSYLANAAWRKVKKDPTYVVTDKERTIFKGVNFGLVYGATAIRIAALLNISLNDAKIVVQSLSEQIPMVFRYLNKIANQALKDGYIIFNQRTNSRRVFKEVLSAKNGGYPVPFKMHGIIGRAAKNAPIQGTNADLMKESMVEVDKYIKATNIDAHILLQVYDELVIEIPDDGHIFKRAEDIQKIMETTADKYLDTTLGIHMKSDYKIANTWQK
jgi:DNA polymerase-1